MRVSIKHAPIGKVAKDFDFATLTRRWLGVDIAPLELVNHITAGMPFSIAHYVDRYRKAAPLLLISSEIEKRKKPEILLLEYSVIPLSINDLLRNLKLRGFLGGAAQFMADGHLHGTHCDMRKFLFAVVNHNTLGMGVQIKRRAE